AAAALRGADVSRHRAPPGQDPGRRQECVAARPGPLAPHPGERRMNPSEAHAVVNGAANGDDSDPNDARVLRAVEEYLAALEAGQPPDRLVFLARHAAIAAQLEKYLDGLELIHRAGSAAGAGAEAVAEAGELAGAEALGDFQLVREVGRGG